MAKKTQAETIDSIVEIETTIMVPMTVRAELTVCHSPKLSRKGLCDAVNRLARNGKAAGISVDGVEVSKISSIDGANAHGFGMDDIADVCADFINVGLSNKKVNLRIVDVI